MAIRWITGFELGTDSPVNECYIGGSGATLPTIQTSVVRTGVYALKVVGNSSASAYGRTLVALDSIGVTNAQTVTQPGTLAAGWVRFYFRYETLNSSGNACLVSGRGPANDNWWLTIDTNAKLTYRGPAGASATGATALNANQWYRIEINFNISDTGAYDVRIDGTTEISGTLDQKGSSDTAIGTLTLGHESTGGPGLAPSAYTFYYDDIAVSDSAFPGPGAIVRLAPAGQGSKNEWVAGTGSGGHAEVDETPNDGDTTYITTSSAGFEEGVTLASLASAGATNITSISSVKSHVVTRDNNQTCNWYTYLLTGGSPNGTSQGDNPGGTAYQARQKVFNTNFQTTNPWTESEVNALQVVVSHQQAQSRPLNCTAMCLMVDYVPAVAQVPAKIVSVTRVPRIRASSY